MRPLRLKEDVNWEKGYVIVRRSQTRGGEVMDFTKTAQDQVIGLPDEMMEVLKWHVSTLNAKQRETGLLFPSRGWGVKGALFKSRSSLDKPFEDTASAIKLGKRITPKGMRRTAVDLQRQADLSRKMRHAVSGHSTEKAQALYETVPHEETRAAVAKVYNMIDYRRTA